MKKLIIELDEEQDVEDILVYITKLIKGGFTSGYQPNWKIKG